MLTRRTRRAERGQTLLLALGFMALFGLLAVAVLRFASVTESQRVATEQTAAAHALAQGAAQWALADTGVQPCGSTSGATLTFPGAFGSGSDTLTYSDQGSGYGCVGVPAGDAPGYDCLLCVLGGQHAPGTSTAATLSISGELDTNVDITGHGAVMSTTAVGLYNGSSCPLCSAPRTVTSGSPFADPLAATFVTPTQHPTGKPAATCSTQQPLQPGTYPSITAANCTVTLQAGTYFVTGPIAVSGTKGLLLGQNVFIYLTCPSPHGIDWKACNGEDQENQSGGNLTVTSHGQVNLSPPSAKGDPYQGISVASDPQLNITLMDFQGGGGSIAGTVYLPGGDVWMHDDDTTNPPAAAQLSVGRLILRSLSITSATAQLTFSGSVQPQCSYYTDSVSGQSTGANPHSARVSFASNCSSGAGGLDSIVEFTFAGP